MALSTAVKWMHSGMAGAPQFSYAWGDLTAILDACLIDGFNLRDVQGLQRSGRTVTLECPSHGFVEHQVIALSGADNAAYNGEHRLTAVTQNTLLFEIDTEPPTPDTGASIRVKAAPLGFTTAFSGENRRAYRSVNPQSPGNLLRVDNRLKTPGYDTTWAKWGNVGIVETMSDIDTLSGAQAPFDPATPEKNWGYTAANQWGWFKWYTDKYDSYSEKSSNSANPRYWRIVGDDRLFYVFHGGASRGNLAGFAYHYLFGDIDSFIPGDAFATALVAHDAPNSISTGAGYFPNGVFSTGFNAGSLLLRAANQISGPVAFSAASSVIATVSGKGNVPFPNGDYGLCLFPVHLQESSGVLRGRLPGLHFLPHTRPYLDGAIVSDVPAPDPRRFWAVESYHAGTPNHAQAAIDITGPWR